MSIFCNTNRLESGSHFNQQRNQKLKSTLLRNQRSALSYPSSPSKLSTPGSWLLGPSHQILATSATSTFPYFVMLLSTSGSYPLEYASENRSRQPERSSSRRCTSLKTTDDYSCSHIYTEDRYLDFGAEELR